MCVDISSPRPPITPLLGSVFEIGAHMRNSWAISLVILSFIWLASGVAAQGESCIEVWNYWSDDVRHTVNLNSGVVTSRQMPEPVTGYQGESSPDGRYNARMEAEVKGSVRYQLKLTDRERGLSIVLADGVSGLEWSPDGKWLAYMQAREDRSLGGLALYHMESGERILGSLPDNNWDMLGIDWSPDGSLIAATFIVDSVFLGSDVQLYSVPDLTLVKTFNTRISSGKTMWSPDGRSIAAYGINDVFAMMDVASGRVFHVGLDGHGYYEADWSPGGSYLLIRHSFGDLAEMMDILNARGEILVQNRYITSSEWVNDHQALVRTWESSGLNDLTLYDLESGDQTVLQAHVGLQALSPDGRLVAAADTLAPGMIRVVDLTGAEAVRDIVTPDEFNSLIWREDDRGLIALFSDRSLREYDLDADEWQTIAEIPGHNWSLQWARCDQS